MPTAIGTLVTSGNALDMAYDTSLISGGRPRGWPSTCFRYTVGAAPADGGCYYYETEQNVSNPSAATPTRVGYLMDVDFIIESLLAVDDTGVSIAVQKGNGDGEFDGVGGTHPILTRLRYHHVSSGLDKFAFTVDEGAEEATTLWPSGGGTIEIGRPYNHQILYDIQNKRVAWWVDGVLTVDVEMTSSLPWDICDKIHGSSKSSDGRSLSWLANWRSWDVARSRVLPSSLLIGRALTS